MRRGRYLRDKRRREKARKEHFSGCVLNITGQPDILVITDYWGNRSGTFNLMQSHKEMIIENKLIVRTLGSLQSLADIVAGFDELKNQVKILFIILG